MENKIGFKLYISYSRQDKELINRLSGDLSKYGIDPFYDDNILQVGNEWQKQLTRAITESDGILILITNNSISSKYVMNELGMARVFAMNSENKKLLIPVIYGNVEIPEFIQDIQVVFWKQNYKEFLNKIVDSVYNFKFTNINEAQERKHEIEVFNDLTNDRANVNDIDYNDENPRFWLLKLNPKTWDIEQFKIGDEYFFHTFYLGDKRPEYKLFKKIRKGDKVLCFGTGQYKSIVCEMVISKSIELDQQKDEVFRLKVINIIKPHIPLESFRDIILSILLKFEKDSTPPELLFQLEESTYKAILASKIDRNELLENNYQPFYLTEGDHHSTLDQLEFEYDINSFASVISLKKVNPPLAIGLFGNWGSGKSFFMEKLSERIEEIVKSDQSDYIKNVVQVKFNSWHYSDSNLWASLTTHIFKSLHDFTTTKKYGDDAIKAIYKDLNITSYQLEETQNKLQVEIAIEKTLLLNKADLQEEIEQKKVSLSMWNARDLVKIVYSDPYIQHDFEDIKNQFEEEKLIENIEQIDSQISKIDTVTGQVVESFKLLKQNSNRKWIWIWILAVILAFCIYLILGPFKIQIEKYINYGIASTGLIAIYLADLLRKISPYLSKIKIFYKRISSLKDTIEKEKTKVKLKEHDEIERINEDLRKLKLNIETIEIEYTRHNEKKIKLEKEIKDIGSGKQLAGFLAKKSEDESYINQLGIISWIRKDFEKLNELFIKQEVINADKKNTPAEIQIDRIVLYIDDLDRCNEDVVVKVLEAIHLLLAFPLFVVVVGVDPRWLNNALSQKYKNLLGKNGAINTENAENLMYFSHTATSYDYLEKIFQIPFALKPINSTGRDKLIKYLTRNEINNASDASFLQDTSTEQQEINQEEILAPNHIDQTHNALNIEDDLKREIKNKILEKPVIFSISELEYMKKISSLYGNTPRTINRYVNIYRIIKSHRSLKILNENPDNDYKPIMFVLGVVIGCSEFAEEFIKNLNESNNDMNFSSFFLDLDMNFQFKDKIQLVIDDLLEMPIKVFKTNLELISRFSFRTLIK